MEVAAKGRPWNISQRGVPLLPRFEMPRINRAVQFRQGLFGVLLKELSNWSSGCLSAVAGGLEHWIDSLWSSVIEV
jgi:hypothetical protein